MKLAEIRQAIADSDAPWYGSDLVPLVADLCDTAEELLHALRELADFSMDDTHYRHQERSKQARQAAYDLLKRLE